MSNRDPLPFRQRFDMRTRIAAREKRTEQLDRELNERYEEMARKFLARRYRRNNWERIAARAGWALCLALWTAAAVILAIELVQHFFR